MEHRVDYTTASKQAMHAADLLPASFVKEVRRGSSIVTLL